MAGMQCAGLNQAPGRLLARGANIKRAHTRTSLLRLCAAVDAHVQTTPQSRAEERKTYLGEKFWQIQPLRDGQQADYRDPEAKTTPPKIRLKNLNHVALEAADPLGLTDFYTCVLGFKSIAFEVEDSDAMEEQLLHFGIEYTKAIVPGTNVAQLFFYDPEGHGIEVGCEYAKVTDMITSKLSTNEAAVAP